MASPATLSVHDWAVSALETETDPERIADLLALACSDRHDPGTPYWSTQQETIKTRARAWIADGLSVEEMLTRAGNVSPARILDGMGDAPVTSARDDDDFEGGYFGHVLARKEYREWGSTSVAFSPSDEEIEQARARVAGLKPREWEVFTATYGDGLSDEAAAKKLRIHRTTVRRIRIAAAAQLGALPVAEYRADGRVAA